MNQSPSKIVIADDHPLYRDALRQAVFKAMPSAEVLEADSLRATKEIVTAQQPVLVCLDLQMRDSVGFSGLIELRHDFPALPVVVVSGSESADVARRAIQFGASGFIPKSASLEQICEALATILQGDEWLPPSSQGESASDADRDMIEGVSSLTPAQLRVLVGISSGLQNKQIAYEMGITEATVKAHVTAVFRKLKVQNRTQAVLAARYLDVENEATAAP